MSKRDDTEAQEQARHEERAAVVAWLLHKATVSAASGRPNPVRAAAILRLLAKMIQEGDHIATAAKPPLSH
jgi:hypothetical protein